MPDCASASSDAAARELRPVLTGLMPALTVASVDQNIVATALPRITSELGGLRHLSWVVTAFLATSTVSAPLYGRLSDLYGRKPAYMLSIIIFLFGSVLCGLAGSLDALIVFRARQGLGAGGLIVLAQTVIAAALLLIAAGLRPRSRGPAARLDLAGIALLVFGTTALLLVLSWGGIAYAWSSTTIVGLIASAAMALLLLVATERRAEQPLLPPVLFRNKVFVLASAVICLTAMSLFAAAVFLPLMFQLLMGASPAGAGLMVAPMMGGVIVASFLGGRLLTRTGRYKRFPVLGLFAAMLSYATLAWTTHASSPAWLVETILVAIGFGLGLVMPNLTTAIQNAVERTELGGATATAAFFRSLGGALGVALAGAVLALHLNGLSTTSLAAGSSVVQIASLPGPQRLAVLAAYRAGLTGAFAAGAALSALAFLIVLFLPELPLRSTPIAPAALDAGHPAKVGGTP
ncbi:MFS transporter [Lichenicoccus sp.]|uniref:MFS transporter n=1 Tax=Lichenicoccus sp. TaxID=2781899 RepID=UPI003D0C206A